MKKRGLALMIALTMILSMIPMTVLGVEFTDMPNDWSTAALERAVANGLIKGSDGKIRATEYLTRAEMAAIINRAFNSVEEDPLTKFSDLSEDSWYYQDMSKAVQMKTLIGSGDKLKPQENVTREEAFLAIARVFKFFGKKTFI